MTPKNTDSPSNWGIIEFAFKALFNRYSAVLAIINYGLFCLPSLLVSYLVIQSISEQEVTSGLVKHTMTVAGKQMTISGTAFLCLVGIGLVTFYLILVQTRIGLQLAANKPVDRWFVSPRLLIRTWLAVFFGILLCALGMLLVGVIFFICLAIFAAIFKWEGDVTIAALPLLLCVAYPLVCFAATMMLLPAIVLEEDLSAIQSFWYGWRAVKERDWSLWVFPGGVMVLLGLVASLGSVNITLGSWSYAHETTGLMYYVVLIPASFIGLVSYYAAAYVYHHFVRTK